MKLIQNVGLLYFIQIIIESWNEIFLLMMVASMFISVKHDKESNFTRNAAIPFTYEILVFYIIVVFYNLADVISVTYDTIGGEEGYAISRMATFFYYLCGAEFTIFFLYVVKKHITSKFGMKRMENLIIFMEMLQGLCIFLLILTPFTNVIYYYDENNIYHRSPVGYWIWYGSTCLAFAVIFICLVLTWKKIDKFIRSIFLTAIIIQSIAFVISLFVAGTSLNNISVTIIAMIIFLQYERYRSLYAVERVREIENMRMTMMLSQIRPHFLQNTLAAIIYYIDVDQEKAKEALTDFSRYLRMNLMTYDYDKEAMVPLENEMEYIEKYVSLEKLRFGDKVKVEFNIKDKGYNVPVLSIEPLVENAIKHGIRNNPGSEGTVKISTFLTEDYHVIEVQDDGVGFDVEKISEIEEGHIGVRNVMDRVKIQAEGRVDIESKIGMGTVCTVLIPR